MNSQNFMTVIKEGKFSKVKLNLSPAWIFNYISLAFVITVFFASLFIVVHQNLRQSANDPQIQISEDVATSLAAGQDPSQIIPNYSIDISKTLSNFVIVYDNDGKVIVSTASLDGKTPEVPKGVLDYAKEHGQNRLTWKHKEGVRSAVVVTHYSDKSSGFVLVGRSLREVQGRLEMITKELAVAWVLTIFVSLLLTALPQLLPLGKKK